jgi:hypothetical protein
MPLRKILKVLVLYLFVALLIAAWVYAAARLLYVLEYLGG